MYNNGSGGYTYPPDDSYIDDSDDGDTWYDVTEAPDYTYTNPPAAKTEAPEEPEVPSVTVTQAPVITDPPITPTEPPVITAPPVTITEPPVVVTEPPAEDPVESQDVEIPL